MGNKHGNIKNKVYKKKEDIKREDINKEDIKKEDINKEDINKEDIKKTELKQNRNLNQITSLEHIKSSYILKYVLSYLDEKLQLNIIINSRHLQNKLGIDIEYYKKVSGRYMI